MFYALCADVVLDREGHAGKRRGDSTAVNFFLHSGGILDCFFLTKRYISAYFVVLMLCGGYHSLCGFDSRQLFSLL